MERFLKFILQHKLQFKRFIFGSAFGAVIFYPVFYVFIWLFGDKKYLLATSIAYFADYLVKFVLNKYWASEDKDSKHILIQASPYLCLCIINTISTYYFVEYKDLSFIQTQIAMILPTSLFSVALFFVWKNMFKH